MNSWYALVFEENRQTHCVRCRLPIHRTTLVFTNGAFESAYQQHFTRSVSKFDRLAHVLLSVVACSFLLKDVATINLGYVSSSSLVLGSNVAAHSSRLFPFFMAIRTGLHLLGGKTFSRHRTAFVLCIRLLQPFAPLASGQRMHLSDYSCTYGR